MMRTSSLIRLLSGAASWVLVAGCGGNLNNQPETYPATVLVSVSTLGAPGVGTSQNGRISGDGRYVVFVSTAPNLVSGDANGKQDVFVRDLENGTTVRASVATNSQEGNGDSNWPAISRDGRYVTFYSTSTNLVGSADEGGSDTNGVEDVFMRDLIEGRTRRISITSSEAQATGGASYISSLSADGRFVAFDSRATNLGPDANTTYDVFVRDTVAGTTTLVSTALSSPPANDASLQPCISADGRYVAFESLATNLHPDDADGVRDIYVRNWSDPSSPTVLVSRSSGSTLPASVKSNNESYYASLSDDGSVVVFLSLATNLVSGDGNAADDIFLRDWQSASPVTRRVSIGSSGQEGNANALWGAVSGDGRHVAFLSLATNLLPDGRGVNGGVFRHSLDSAIAQGVSVATSGLVTQGAGASGTVSISSDGKRVVFDSSSGDLYGGDTNGFVDVFARMGLE